METFELIAESRTTEEKNSAIRGDKKLPGIIYGKTQTPIMIKFDGATFMKLQRKVSGSRIVNVKLDGTTYDVLIHDFQKDPVMGDFIHVDFYAVTKWQKVTVAVALAFTGDSQAKKDGCIIETQLKEITVRCEPKDLVDSFNVDMTKLSEEGTSIKVADLDIDRTKFTILTPGTDVIVTAIKVEEEVISNAAPVSGIQKTEAELAAEKAALAKKEEKKDK
jgi:large subunit ribosomal protein L25